MDIHYLIRTGEQRMAVDIRNIREEVLQLHAHIWSGQADPNRILMIYNLVDGAEVLVAMEFIDMSEGGQISFV